MLSATKAYICSAFMAWAGTTDTATSPSWVSSIGEERNSVVQWESLQIQIGKFVDEYVLTEFDIGRAWQEQLEQNLQEKENQRTLRLAGNDDETNAISSPAQQPCPSGMSMYSVLSYVSRNNKNSIYTLSDLGVLSNLIGSLSLAKLSIIHPLPSE